MLPENLKLEPSPLLLNKLESFEGFLPVAIHQSFDPPGVYTFAFGDTNCKPGQRITIEQARILLKARVKRDYADPFIRQITVPLTQGQYDAGTDFCYNCGLGNAKNMISLINAGDNKGAEAEILKHVYANGKKLQGLVTRRAVEEGWFERGEPVGIHPV